MSFQLMTWAMSKKCGSAASKMVLLMLANHANGHTGRCTPRNKTLAEECEMRVETLKNHLRHLEELGYVTIIPRFSEGTQMANQYNLNYGAGGGDFRMGEGGDFRMGEGGDFRMGEGGENRTTVKQEVKQEYKQEEAPRKRDAAPPCPPDVDQQTWSDWLKLRKTKKAPVTETVIRSAIAESEKAGMTLEQFLQVWCARGSQGLEASWLNTGRWKNDAHGSDGNMFSGAI